MTDSRKNKFGIGSIDDISIDRVPRRRGSGPMSSAVRETAENVTESTEARVEQRRQNAADAQAYRTAVDDGLMLHRIPVDQILTNDLPRDRLDLDGVAASDEMDELKASIRAHGQKEPIELFLDSAGSFQLKKGWRRLTALRAIHAETGEDRFATVLARIDGEVNDRLRHYVDMVEENILRQDLTYAEMAEVAIKAAADPEIDGNDPESIVLQLYSSLHKMKRSHIRSFVKLIASLGHDLPFPKAVPRDLGLEVARQLAEQPGQVGGLCRELTSCGSIEEQNTLLRNFGSNRTVTAISKPAGRTSQKFEFHVGGAKVTARKGEFRIKDRTDFTDVPREKLEAAVAAFQKVLSED